MKPSSARWVWSSEPIRLGYKRRLRGLKSLIRPSWSFLFSDPTERATSTSCAHLRQRNNGQIQRQRGEK